MRIILIGGLGFIGGRVARRLIDTGHDVVCIHRGGSRAVPQGVEVWKMDQNQLLSNHSMIQARRFDIAIDMIANCRAHAATTLKTFARSETRLVVISSSDVYRARDRLWRADPGPPDTTPLAEDAPLRTKRHPYRSLASGPDDPRFCYEKLEVEELIKSARGSESTILRLPAVYGPGDPQHRVFEYLRLMDYGRPAIVLAEPVARWRWTRGYVDNIAAAITMAATSCTACGNIYNVGETTPFSERSWVEAIGRAAGWSGQVLVAPVEDLPTSLREDTEKYDFRQDWVLECGAFQRELSFEEPVTHEVALAETVAWERVNPPSPPPPLSDLEAENTVLRKYGYTVS